MPGCLFQLLLVGVPAFDAWLLFRIGSVLGGWLTLGLTLGSMLVGLAVARAQRAALVNLPAQLAAGTAPPSAVGDMPMLLMASLLFVLPGFVTDALGWLLLIKPVRRAVSSVALRRMVLLTRAAYMRPGEPAAERGAGAGAGPASAAGPGPAPFRPAQDIKDLPPDRYSVRDERETP